MLLAALPAGAKQAAVVSRDGDLWLGARQLTAGPAADSWPDRSPDGRRVAFSRREPGGRGSSIWVVRRDGGGLARLTGGRETVDVMPAWSPDGRRIAYASSPLAGGSFDVFVVGARGGEPRRAAGGPGDEIAPAWDSAGVLRVQRIKRGFRPLDLRKPGLDRSAELLSLAQYGSGLQDQPRFEGLLGLSKRRLHLRELGFGRLYFWFFSE